MGAIDGDTLCGMDKITQIEIIAHAFLGGLVDLHGREHAAHILTKLAEGLMAGLPVDGQCRCGDGHVTPKACSGRTAARRARADSRNRKKGPVR